MKTKHKNKKEKVKLYHHLVNGVDDVVHFSPRDETVVVNIVEFERPWNKKKMNNKFFGKKLNLV